MDAETRTKLAADLDDARELYHTAATSRGDAADEALIRADRILFDVCAVIAGAEDFRGAAKPEAPSDDEIR